MRAKLIIVGVFLSIIFIGVGVGLYWMAGKIGTENHRRSIAAIRKIQQVESQWSIETARVRSDPFADFDALVTFIPRMDRLRDDLADAMLGIPDLPEKLANDLNAYLSAIEAKEERIERFKTGYAILRNSVRYLPLAATNVMQQVQERGGEPAFVRNISVVTDEINSYLATPAPPEKERLMRVLQELGDGIITRHPALTNTIANFVAHGQVLLDKQAPTEEIFQKATSNIISDVGESLIGDLEAEIDEKEELISYYYNGMLASGGALWLTWLAIAIQLPKSKTRWEPRQEAAGEANGRIPPAPPPPRPDRTLATAGPALPPRETAQDTDRALAKLTADLMQAEKQLGGGAHPTRATEATSYRVGLEIVGGKLKRAAERISSSMDILNEMQGKLRGALTGGQAGRGNGNGLAEEMKTAAAVVSSIRAQTSGIVELAERLPAFSQKQNDAYAQVNLNDYIDDIVENVRGETTALVVKELNPIPGVFALGTELDLMLRNVIQNSVQAVQERGQDTGVIRIETKQEGEEVQVTITDNGVGVTSENCKKVFNPFYTSKSKALGMGLTSSQHLVEKYKGSISIHSLPGQGTMVRISLPTGAIQV